MGKLTDIKNGKTAKPPRLIIYGQEGLGKAQPLDAKILTPTGWSTMGDMKIGSKVIGSDGVSHNVIGVFPQGEKEIFDVIFEDGTRTQCCNEHLWYTETAYEHDAHIDGCVRSLDKIRKTIKYGTRFNHRIPRVRPVQFDCNNGLPMSPWLLGIYLAEGNSRSSVVISNQEEYIQKRIEKELPCGDSICKFKDGHAIRISHPGSNECSTVLSVLRSVGLCGMNSDKKFIPQEYMTASVNDRIELLRGLADGDGNISKDSKALEICTASDKMAEDILFVARSLGFCASIVKRHAGYTKDDVRVECKDSNRIVITNWGELVPVSSPKHIDRIKTIKYNMCHLIVDVKSAGKKECQCIMVDSKDELYVTDDFIVTHNTTLASTAPNPIFIQTEDGLGSIDTNSFPVAKSYDDVIESITELAQEDHDYKTLVIDSADWLEPLIFAKLCKDYGVRSIEKVDQGYGKGYVYAAEIWKQLCDAMNYLRDTKNMGIIIIAHSIIRKFEDPENATYDRYQLRLNQRANDILVEWADAVLFACKKMVISKSDDNRAIARGIGNGGGERILRTNSSPACIAKNRYNMPDEIPLLWSAIEQYLSPNK